MSHNINGLGYIFRSIREHVSKVFATERGSDILWIHELIFVGIRLLANSALLPCTYQKGRLPTNTVTSTGVGYEIDNAGYLPVGEGIGDWGLVII